MAQRDTGSKFRRKRLGILRQYPICQHCHVRFSTRIEHVKPLQFGGGNERDNLAAYCERCAREKDRAEARIAGGTGKRRKPKFKGWDKS